MTNRTAIAIQIYPPPNPSQRRTPPPHARALLHPKHTNTCTHPTAHLLSKSRKKWGQFSKSLPRTLMRFPMAGDLDGRKQQNAYSTRTWQTGLKSHTENREGLFLLFYPSALIMSPLFAAPPPPFCPNNMSVSDILVVNDTDEGSRTTNARSIGWGGGGRNPELNH